VRADIVIVGGGPAGLATAVGAARRGLSAVVLERRGWPLDKACGEGLMPAGVRALERLGARALIDPAGCAPFVGVRYLQEDGTTALARFGDGAGLGVRRPALVGALLARARELGVTLRAGARVQRHLALVDGIAVELDDDERVEGRMLVAADGLASPLRHAFGLDRPACGPRRFGLRQHFRLAPWSEHVEVTFSDGVEAYVTPAGAERVGVAFLWEDGVAEKPISFPALLNRFPDIARRLAGAPPDSTPRGAGPLLRGVRARTAERFALVGDAAGYVDAITGEGLSLAFHCAEALCAILPDALARGATRASLAPYEREVARAFRRYAMLTRGLLLLSRRPRLRRAVIRLLARHEWLFERILAWVVRAPAGPGHDLPPALSCAE
jgi:flavin-dependent dehydrogenase